MKVWEKINDLKGTNADKETIASWAYNNKICPREFGEELELDCDYPQELESISCRLCNKNSCGYDCLTEFLESEVECNDNKTSDKIM